MSFFWSSPSNLKRYISNRGYGGLRSKGCSGCGKAHCQACNVISNCDSLEFKVTVEECKINYSFNCDSCGVSVRVCVSVKVQCLWCAVSW